MKKKVILPIGILVAAIASILIYIGTQPKILNEWSSDKETVLTNKVWKIELSQKVDVQSVSTDSIYVTNENDEKQKVKLEVSDDKKSIAVLPPEEGYELTNSFYTLHIENDIQTLVGRSLQAGKKITFNVKETLPLVGSKEKLDDIFKTALKREKDNRSVRLFDMGVSMEESKANDTQSGSNDAGAGGQEHSETNIQVDGVDEADTVKTDGTHIYQVLDGKVVITKALPADKMKVDGMIQYKENYTPSQLFLFDSQLVVIGHSYDDKVDPQEKRTQDSLIWPGYFYSTTALVYDITDKSNPKQIREVEIEGSFVTARRINNYVYMIANHYPDFWTMEENENVDLRPRYSDSAKDSSKQMVDYKKIQYIPNSHDTNYTIIASFDLEQSNKEAEITTYLGGGDQIYMSKENLYLAVTNYGDSISLQRGSFSSPDTELYKFSVAKEHVTFHSSTDVEGTVLNQFSMDEYNGYFRVATTKGDMGEEERPSANNLFIFDENLKIVGKLDNLARGERIYSARFMQERIYIVTFKQVDPLFVIDTSDPTKPIVLGELKIPGFSNYLHPYDENHLIGVGHDTKVVPSKQSGEEPLVYTQGVKLSLFDISDVNNPQEKFSEIIGGRGTYTPLNYDHKALLYNKKSGLFAFPISIYHDVKESEYEQKFDFQGAYVYDVSLEKGFTLSTKISHMDNKAYYEEWEDTITRLVYIGDYLYAISPTKMTAHQLDNFNLVGEVEY